MIRQISELGRQQIVLMVLASTLWGDQLPLQLKPIRKVIDFEAETPEVLLWATNGEQDVHFLGVTAEKAKEGKCSLKLDVTLKSGHYHYWGAPLRAVCEGKLLLRGDVYLDPASSPDVRVGFGCNMAYPPTTHSGCGTFETVRRDRAGQWVHSEADLVERGKTGRDSVLRRHTVNLNGENAGTVLDKWSLFVYGKPGSRVIVYLDAIELIGETPPEEAYDEILAARFEEVKAKFRERLRSWQERYAEASEALSDLSFLPSLAKQRDYVKTLQQDLGEQLKGLENQAYIHPEKAGSLEKNLALIEHAPANFQKLEEQMRGGSPFGIYAFNSPITNIRQIPTLPPFHAESQEELSIAACAGEIESASLVVYAIADLRRIELVPSPLNGPAGTIPAQAFDVRHLVWWYQGKGQGIGYSPEREFKAELLVKDPGLVRVDQNSKENYLRSMAPDGAERYVLCSGDDSSTLEEVRPQDSERLLPIDIPAGESREFWVNVRVPPDTGPGVYHGHIDIKVPGKKTTNLPVELTVPPFRLEPSRLVYSIYYRAKLAPDNKPTIGSEIKSEEQYRAEIADMRDHGVIYPTNYQGWGEAAACVGRMLQIRNELNMPTDYLFNLGCNTGNTDDPAKLEDLQNNVRKWLALTRKFGYRECYFYGLDEAKGDRLKSQQKTWETVQDAGGKTFVACYLKTFEAMGKRLNCAVLAGPPRAEEAEKWHSVGSMAFCYAFPQVGVEAPETYRRNFGLCLWKAGYDGAMDYAYQHGFGHVWNDFDSPKYRDHNFTYPTVNGVVGTIQWEGFREAVDDVRYVTTLEKAIREAPDNKKKEADAARKWLEELAPQNTDLDAVRYEMVRRIEELKQ